MSYIKFPIWTIKLINSLLAHCFWDDYDGHHKYHLANRGALSLKREYGDLGITDLSHMNLCLLASWVSRYHRDEGKICKSITDARYNTQSPNIFTCPP